MERLKMKRTYRCEGAVRGSCGHKHRTIETAVACLHGDQMGCRRQGGYSDRIIVDSDGGPLTDDERYLAERVEYNLTY